MRSHCSTGVQLLQGETNVKGMILHTYVHWLRLCNSSSWCDSSLHWAIAHRYTLVTIPHMLCVVQGTKSVPLQWNVAVGGCYPPMTQLGTAARHNHHCATSVDTKGGLSNVFCMILPTTVPIWVHTRCVISTCILKELLSTLHVLMVQ